MAGELRSIRRNPHTPPHQLCGALVSAAQQRAYFSVPAAPGPVVGRVPAGRFDPAASDALKI